MGAFRNLRLTRTSNEFVDSQRFNSVCLFGVYDAFSKLLQAIPKSDLSTYVLCLMIYLMSYDLCLMSHLMSNALMALVYVLLLGRLRLAIL